jgi:hypothetical protein
LETSVYSNDATQRCVPEFSHLDDGSAYCLHNQVIMLMMEAVRISETSVYSNETRWRYIPEGCHLEDESLSRGMWTV